MVDAAEPQSQSGGGNPMDWHSSTSSPYRPKPSTSIQTHSSSDDETDIPGSDVRSLFQKASKYIYPGPAFRLVVRLYAERKLLVLFLVHFMSTMVIFFHFFLIKFQMKQRQVQEGTPLYWWKRIVPPLEFASMHAVLFQLALIPLTMSRYTIAALSDSYVDRFVPLNRILRMHIHLGYVVVICVLLASFVFLIFFGRVCADERNRGLNPAPTCSIFRSEIMCTGYSIQASMLIVLGTSYFRHRIPYEVFYAVHHLVFAIYIIAVAHTFDNVQRNHEAKRSQTFTWFSSTILYYICDRAAMHLNHKYCARIVNSSTIKGGCGLPRMVHLQLKRPPLFIFKPGQYAFLKLGLIDVHWHPFSIASDPLASTLEFYLEVFDDESWTGKLWSLLESEGVQGISMAQIEFEVMGPYGTSLARTKDYSHALAIGTGTGIVPVLSLFKQHVRQLLQLAPEAHCRLLREQRKNLLEVEIAEEFRKGSFFSHVANSCGDHRYVSLGLTKADTLRNSIRDSIIERDEVPGSKSAPVSLKRMKMAALRATRSIYGVVLLTVMPVLGISVLALTISWNTTPAKLYPGMTDALQIASVVFQTLFACIVFFVVHTNHFFAYVDVALCMVAPFAHWYWFNEYDSRGRLKPSDIAIYSMAVGYMTLRVWYMTVKPRHKSRRDQEDGVAVLPLEKLELVWVSRSAALVAEILPHINETWTRLVEAWGEKNARSVCRVTICITDKGENMIDQLTRTLAGTALWEAGSIRFGRPDFAQIIEDHEIELISTMRSSHTVLCFVGSATLASEVHHDKVSTEVKIATTGNKKHQLDFVSEVYGGFKSPANEPVHETANSKDAEDDNDKVLPSRRTTFYEN